MGTLTTDRVKRLTEPGRYGDGGGLYLVVAPGSSKSWVLRVQQGGKRTDRGLGGYPTVTLATARRLAEDARVSIRRGGLEVSKPRGDRNRGGDHAVLPRAKRMTFEAMARNVHAVNVDAGLWCERNADNWIHRAERHLFPAIGSRRIDEVPVAVLRDDILRPLANEMPETAKRLRIIMRQTFQQALEDGLIEANPIDRIPAARLRRPVPVHRRALPYQEVPDAMRTLRRYRGAFEGKPWAATLGCIEFMILTAARPGEARNATWEEIDLKARTWTIPAAKMKSRRDHVVPLGWEALSVLIGARELGDGHGVLFPNPGNGRPISAKSLEERFVKEGLDCVPHGFRSSFRDWAAEVSGASWEAIELSLAHQIGTTTSQAYFRTALLEQRRPLMQAWGDFIFPTRSPF